MAKRENPYSEILEIKEMLQAIHKDMKRFIEKSSQQHLDSVLSGSRANFTNAIIGHVLDDIEGGLENNMVRRCDMYSILNP